MCAMMTHVMACTPARTLQQQQPHRQHRPQLRSALCRVSFARHASGCGHLPKLPAPAHTDARLLSPPSRHATALPHYNDRDTGRFCRTSL